MNLKGENLKDGYTQGNINMVNVIRPSNQDLIQAAKDSNGEIYHRINSLQLEVNRLREENERLRKNHFSNEEVKKMREVFQHALEFLS